MTDETPNSQSDSNGSTTPPQPKKKLNSLTIEAGDLRVEAESHELDVDELMEVCSPEMESVMEYHLVGDMAAIEERDLFGEIFGGHR